VNLRVLRTAAVGALMISVIVLPKAFSKDVKTQSDENTLLFSLGENSADFELARQQGMEKALKYLESIQKEDGGFPSYFGLGTTELAMLCFQNRKEAVNPVALKKGLGYILTFRKPDGSFYSDSDQQGKEKTSFTTALAIRLFASAKENKDKQIVKDALNWIKGIQNIDGGFGYYKGSRSDITATTFCIRALNDGYKFLGLQKNDETWLKAYTYIKNMRNENGGFGYIKKAKQEKEEGEENEPQPTAPYGSATASGLISSFYTEQGDAAISKTINWVEQHYTLDENPLDPDPKHYQYYIQELATALSLTAPKTITDKNGQKRDWYREIVNKMLAEQDPSGFWSTGQEPLFTTYFISVMQLEKIEKENTLK
jgi:squalene-hopene/tetraprenyl-beta-curcumene cyclase